MELFKSVHFCETDPGTSWVKDDVPVIDTDGDYDSFWALTPNVIKLPQGNYRLFYTACTKEKRAAGILGYIVSASSAAKASRWVKDPMIRIDNFEPLGKTWVYCPDVIPLGNGRWRMYFQAKPDVGPDSIMSAVSTDTLSWQIEPEFRLRDPGHVFGAPRVLPLASGGFRMYFYAAPLTQNPDKPKTSIFSARSEDGLKFTIERECVVQESELEAQCVYAPEVLALGTGGFRMYYAAWSKNPVHGRILSATSEDGLVWKKDAQINIDCGGKFDTIKASEPCVYQAPDGRYRMLYEACDDKGTWRILGATSASIR